MEADEILHKIEELILNEYHASTNPLGLEPEDMDHTDMYDSGFFFGKMDTLKRVAKLIGMDV